MNNCGLEGITIALIDHTRIEQLGFSGERVIATLGFKDEAVCAPVLNLEIIGDNTVKIFDDSFEIILDDINIGEERLICLRNGERAEYNIISRADNNRKKRFLP